jgi:hypothetical protein
MNSNPSIKPWKSRKLFSSSILLWIRSDLSRQEGMDYWKGPHSQIIAATPGFEEYRQIHLEEVNPGRWPAIAGVETTIPSDRKVDGLAEVTLHSALSPLQGREQTRMAFADEVNVFRRTLLYAGAPGWSRWYDVGGPQARVGARSLVYLRRKPGVRAGAFRAFVTNELVPALAEIGILTELRTQAFLPWFEFLWDTPNVAHDNPKDQHFHASLILGFADAAQRSAFYASDAVARFSSALAANVAAIHAYNVSAALTYVENGKRLDHYRD